MPNWEAGRSGALTYGATGAGIGASVGGPLGAGIGAGVGLLAGGLHGLFSGGNNKDRSMQQANALQGRGGPNWPGYNAVSNYTPEQMELFQQQFGQTGPQGYLSRLANGNPEEFEQMEAPAFQQFNELQGQLGSRFSQAGGRKSSGFQNATNSAASQFAQQLQANRLNIRNQAIYGLQDMSNQLLNQRPYSMMERQPSGFETFASQLAPAFASKGAEYLFDKGIPWAKEKWGNPAGGTAPAASPETGASFVPWMSKT